MKYYDNTRLSDFKDCPRKFYFRHIRHWRRKGLAAPLGFGLAWHDAMDIVWGLLGKKDDDTVMTLAYEKFISTWVAEGFPHPDEMTPDEFDKYNPRVPATALEMLWNYIEQRKEFITSCEVLAIERPFAVPLSADNPNLFYIGRLDKEVRHNGRVYIIEHKTTSAYSKDKGIRPQWTNGWSPNSQVDGYLHTGKIVHGNELKSVYVDGALVHKLHHDIFKFVPIERHLQCLEDWAEETGDWIDQVETRKALFGESLTKAFPKNTNECNGKYGTCSYLDVCKYVPDVEKLVEPPEGFKMEKWSPFSILGLDKIGMEPEE